MAISDDRGESWRASGPIIGPALNQPSVVRRRDGTLLAYMREEAFALERRPAVVPPDSPEPIA